MRHANPQSDCPVPRKRASVFLAAVSILLLSAAQAQATPIVTALFEGFPLEGSANTGLDELNTKLEMTDFGRPFRSRVFGFFEQESAFDYIRQNNDVNTLVLIGHSLGGDSVIELAENYLKPSVTDVDLAIQIDSVGIGDEELPPNVVRGINYFQRSTGFFEPQGATFVRGSENFNVEFLFNDPGVTHTSIDNDPRLHDLIIQDIRSLLIPSLQAQNPTVPMPEPSAGSSRCDRPLQLGFSSSTEAPAVGRIKRAHCIDPAFWLEST